MRKYIINLSGVKSVYDIHKTIQEGLKFPDYYGNNLDALWDCLADIDAPVEIFIYGTEKLGKEMKEFFKEKVIKVFNQAKDWFGENKEIFEFAIVAGDTFCNQGERSFE